MYFDWVRENSLDTFVCVCVCRKATRQMVDAWLVSHSLPSGGAGSNPSATPSGSADTDLSSPSSGQPGMGNSSKAGSGMATPVRKISAHEFERGGLLRPLVSNVDGTLTFISPVTSEETHALINHNVKPFRRNRNELKSLDEKELIFELVKDICNDLDVRSLCHKILQVRTGRGHQLLCLLSGRRDCRVEICNSHFTLVNDDGCVWQSVDGGGGRAEAWTNSGAVCWYCFSEFDAEWMAACCLTLFALPVANAPILTLFDFPNRMSASWRKPIDAPYSWCKANEDPIRAASSPNCSTSVRNPLWRKWRRRRKFASPGGRA